MTTLVRLYPYSEQIAALKAALKPVATSGSYADLTDKPVLGTAAALDVEDLPISTAQQDALDLKADASALGAEVERATGVEEGLLDRAAALEVGLDAADARAIDLAAEVADGRLTGGQFGRGGGQARPGLRFVDGGGRIAGAFDINGNPDLLWFGSFGRGSSDYRAGIAILSGDGRQLSFGARDPEIISSFGRGSADVRGDGMTLISADSRRLRFDPDLEFHSIFGRGAQAMSALQIMTADGRMIALGQGDWSPDNLPLAEPRAEAGKSLVWRDGAALRLRDPIDALYTRPRAQWFTDLASLYALYDALVDAHPGYASRTSLGQDALGNDIYQYAFTPAPSPVNRSGGGDKLLPEDVAPPKVVILSGTHGSERSAQMGTYMFAALLCNGWREREEYRRLRFGARIVIIPAATPSAVDAGTRTNHNGVDCNRNYDWRWEEASPDPGNFYRGPSPASELEVQILQTLPALHPDAVGIIDRHDHGAGDLLFWIANAEPAVQSAVNRVAEQLAADVYRLEISPDMPLTQPSVWLTGAIGGNGVGYWAAQGVPAMFVEQPHLASYPLLGDSTIALHRAAEALTQRMVTGLIDHHQKDN